jgi:hypothetical protein
MAIAGRHNCKWQYHVLLERLGDKVSAHVGDNLCRHDQSREVAASVCRGSEEKKKRSRRVAVIECCCCWRGAAVFQRWAVIGVKRTDDFGPSSLIKFSTTTNHQQSPHTLLPRCSNTFDTPNLRRITHKYPHNTSAPFASTQTPTWPKRSPPSSWSSSVTAVPER